jgi:hypothetical protein
MLDSFKRYMMLNESMNVTVVDHHPDVATNTMYDLCNYLFKNVAVPMEKRLSPEEMSAIQYDIFSVDGTEDDNKTTGTINFYVRSLSPQSIANMIRGVEYFLKEIGVQIGKITPDTHGEKMVRDLDKIHKMGDDDFDPDFPEVVPQSADSKKKDYMSRLGQVAKDQIRVMRIPVLGRDRNLEKVNTHPKLNLADASAQHIFGQLLGYQVSRDAHGHGYGPISAHDLYIKVESLLKSEKLKAVTPGIVQQDPGKVSVVHSGFSEERIDRILDSIVHICKWAIENGYQNIEVS